MDFELDDKNLFLGESFDFEQELQKAISELTEEEKLHLQKSNDLPECIISALEKETWNQLPKSA